MFVTKLLAYDEDIESPSRVLLQGLRVTNTLTGLPAAIAATIAVKSTKRIKKKMM